MTTVRTDWCLDEVTSLYNESLPELMYHAQTVHRQHFNPKQIQISTLLSIKTGRCPEDCAYCPQSGHYNTGLEKEPLIDTDAIIIAAKKAKDQGASRFCMGAAWRSPPKKAMPALKDIIKKVNDLGLETCMTLGMLDEEQVHTLEAAGLHYYNHNLDTSAQYYPKIISTRTYQDRLDTLERIRQSNIKTCCGGIVGMGETRQDRIAFLHQLATLKEHPHSVPINQLIAIPGTPLEHEITIEPIELVRTIAVARIIMPSSMLRLSAGRDAMSDEVQTLCFLAGANSIFYGETLLTAPNPNKQQDDRLLNQLGFEPMPATTT